MIIWDSPKFFIRDAKLKNISPAIISSLASYGIETAADVRLKSHIKVPSVGIERSQELRLWVTKIETQFVYQSNGKDDAIENEMTKKIIFDHTRGLLVELQDKINYIKNLNKNIRSKMNSDIELFKINFMRRYQIVEDLKFNEIKANPLQLRPISKPSPTRRFNPLNLEKISSQYALGLGSNFINTTPTNAFNQQTVNLKINKQVPSIGVTPNPNSVNIPTTNKIPDCPNCNSRMIQRLAKRGINKGNYFWGCSRFPKCKGTRPL